MQTNLKSDRIARQSLKIKECNAKKGTKRRRKNGKKAQQKVSRDRKRKKKKKREKKLNLIRSEIKTKPSRSVVR
jgi:hypothetical protein